MSRRTLLLLTLTFGLFIAAGMSGFQPARPSTPSARPETPVANFALPDHRGKRHTLAELVDRRAVVIVFVGAGCPLARLYGPRLAEMADEYGPRGAAFLAVNANAQDSLADLAAYARTHHLPFPVLKDPDQALADRLGVERTPEVFVLDGERVVRYRGRIDDQYSVGVRRPRPENRDLAAALDDILAGRPVARPVTQPSGCRIGRRPQVEPHGAVTYCRDVAPILRRHCVECHRPGEAAPFALTTYREVAGWASMIAEVLADGRMPPWLADPRFGHFANDPRLNDAEKQTVLAWIDHGCPEGDARDLPPAAPFVRGWRIGRPERVVYMAERPFAVPAEGEVEYQYFLADPGFTEDRYVRAVEVRPGNRAVVHHALVQVVPPGQDRPGPDDVGALIDYAPGMGPTVLPEGTALRIPAGSRFLFQMHYTPNGAPQEDRSYLGLVFVEPAKVKKCVRGGAVVNPAIDIPPGAADYRLTAEQVMTEDVQLLSLSPHMHLRGRAFRWEAVYPDGRREVLLDVPHYDFNWQLRYDLAQPLRLPRGTRLVCSARYDNSSANPANPDPAQAVGWGDRTRDEMLIGFFAAVPATD
jgi:peroxiredoxin